MPLAHFERQLQEIQKAKIRSRKRVLTLSEENVLASIRNRLKKLSEAPRSDSARLEARRKAHLAKTTHHFRRTEFAMSRDFHADKVEPLFRPHFADAVPQIYQRVRWLHGAELPPSLYEAEKVYRDLLKLRAKGLSRIPPSQIARILDKHMPKQG